MAIKSQADREFAFINWAAKKIAAGKEFRMVCADGMRMTITPADERAWKWVFWWEHSKYRQEVGSPFELMDQLDLIRYPDSYGQGGGGEPVDVQEYDVYGNL